MRILFLCPACERLTVFSEFRVDGDVLLLRCARCSVESQSRAHEAAPNLASVAAAAGSPAARPKAPLALISTATRPVDAEQALSIPEGHCPKCIAVRPANAVSCAHCGLVFENFKPEELEPSPTLAEQFRRLLSNWEDVAEHDRVLQAALMQGELPLLGRLYRIRLAREPGDAYAARGRDEVLRLATASSAGLARSEPTSSSSSRSVRLAAALVATLIFLAVGLFFLSRLSRGW